MNLSVGIIGLPNVGKSTLFNALLKKQQALAANYPFATIEPNVGIVPVPNQRLDVLADIIAKGDSIASLQDDKKDSGQVRMTGKRPPIKPATVEFVDIAGLVKGASEGAGLGNKFLSHIREVSIIAHVVRAFTDENVIREGSIDPKSDYQTIETELMLADLFTIISAQQKMKRSVDANEKSALDKLRKGLDDGKPARDVALSEEEGAFARTLFLLSAKPEVIVLNIAEDEYVEKNISPTIYRYSQILGISQDHMIVISAKVESDIANFPENEQVEYLESLGLRESGLGRLIKKAYQTLGLISFLTAGEKEVRAWTIEKGTKAVDAAGVIHTDFTKKFIKAEVISCDDFVSLNGWKKAREAGKARLEGRDYIMKDGDVVEFKIGT